MLQRNPDKTFDVEVASPLLNLQINVPTEGYSPLLEITKHTIENGYDLEKHIRKIQELEKQYEYLDMLYKKKRAKTEELKNECQRQLRDYQEIDAEFKATKKMLQCQSNDYLKKSTECEELKKQLEQLNQENKTLDAIRKSIQDPLVTIDTIKELITQEHVELKHPEPIETELIEWQWQDDDGSFKTYPSHISRHINKCDNKCTISILQNGGHVVYDIDIGGKTQISRMYKQKRAIRTNISKIFKKRYNTQLILGNRIPKNWIPQTDFVCFVDLPKTHDIYTETQKYISANIILIQRVQCPYRLNRFFNWMDVHSNPNTKLMLHGTFLYPPQVLLEELDGLDYRVSGSNKYLGYGTYFTSSFEYVKDYVYKTAELKQVIICVVALGNCIDVGTKRHPEMRKPPENYDSVSGSSDGTTMDLHCVYNNAQVYPEYIVTFA